MHQTTTDGKRTNKCIAKNIVSDVILSLDYICCTNSVEVTPSQESIASKQYIFYGFLFQRNLVFYNSLDIPCGVLITIIAFWK